MATADDSKGRATGVAGGDFSPPEWGQELDSQDGRGATGTGGATITGL